MCPHKVLYLNVISVENLGNGHLRSTRWSNRTSPIGTLNWTLRIIHRRLIANFSSFSYRTPHGQNSIFFFLSIYLKGYSIGPLNEHDFSLSKNLQQTGKKVKGKNKINKRIESNKNFFFCIAVPYSYMRKYWVRLKASCKISNCVL